MANFQNICSFSRSEIKVKCQQNLVTSSGHIAYIVTKLHQFPFRGFLFIVLTHTDGWGRNNMLFRRFAGRHGKCDIIEHVSHQLRLICTISSRHCVANVNPLKGSDIRWLHFKVFSAIQI